MTLVNAPPKPAISTGMGWKCQPAKTATRATRVGGRPAPRLSLYRARGGRLFWYHPHPHGRTAFQVASLAKADSRARRALAAAADGIDERVLMITDQRLLADGRIALHSDARLDGRPRRRPAAGQRPIPAGAERALAAGCACA